MRINVLREGDRVLSVTVEFIAVERVSGEVDILPLAKDDAGLWVDTQNMVTIGYGNNTVQVETVDGVEIVNF